MKTTVEVEKELDSLEQEITERNAAIQEFQDRMAKAWYEEMLMSFDIFG